MAESFESALFDEFLTRTMAQTKCVHSLLHVALACDQVDAFLHIVYGTIRQQINM